MGLYSEWICWCWVGGRRQQRGATVATRRNADELISIKAGGLTGMITAGWSKMITAEFSWLQLNSDISTADILDQLETCLSWWHMIKEDHRWSDLKIFDHGWRIWSWLNNSRSHLTKENHRRPLIESQGAVAWLSIAVLHAANILVQLVVLKLNKVVEEAGMRGVNKDMAWHGWQTEQTRGWKEMECVGRNLGQASVLQCGHTALCSYSL